MDNLVGSQLGGCRYGFGSACCYGFGSALHIYAELAAAGHDPADVYPGIAAHLAACGPCGENSAGLLAAVTGRQPS